MILFRILVFSDTHRHIGNCLNVIDNLINIDAIIHLGDLVCDAEAISYVYPEINVVKIRGNNDFACSVSSEAVVEFEGINIFCCHGHNYSKNALFEAAKSKNCSIILCGHTHRSEIIKENGITLLNPGSISRPRDSFFSYGVIEIENGKFDLDVIKGDIL